MSKFKVHDRVFVTNYGQMATVVEKPYHKSHSMYGYVTVQRDGSEHRDHVFPENLKLTPDEGPDLAKIPPSVLRDIRERMTLDVENVEDQKILFGMSREQMLKDYLEWNGILGYTHLIESLISAFDKKV